MSGAQAKRFSCRVAASSRGLFAVWRIQMWEMAPGRCKFHGFLLAYFFLTFFFSMVFFTLLVTTCIEFSPVVCRKFPEASQIGEWLR